MYVIPTVLTVTDIDCLFDASHAGKRTLLLTRYTATKLCSKIANKF